MLLRLRYDATETFTLSGGGSGNDAAVSTVNFFPTTPTFDTSIVDEIERIEASRVVEPIELVLAGTSAEVVAAVSEIEDILMKAVRGDNSITEESVYLEYQAYSAATTYRSRVTDGRLEWSNETGLRYLPDSGDTTVKVYIFLTRVGYWEGASTAVFISNTASSGATTTSGRTIYNYDGATAGHDNYVDIASNQIAGRLPTPLKIRMKNTTGGAQTYKHIHIGVASLSGVGLDWTIEGEDCDASSSGSNVVSGSASGGYVRQITNVGTTTRVIAFPLDYGQMQQAKGRYFRVVGRFTNDGTGVYAKLTVRNESATGTLLAEGPEVLISGSYTLKDLGAIPLPPGGYDAVLDEMWLVVEFRAASTQTIELDYIQFFPTESYRYIVQRGDSLASNDSIYDDQMEYPVKVYAEDASTSYRKRIYVPTGRTYAFPNRDTRILFLWDGTGVLYTDTLLIQVWCRPRVITV